MDNTENAALWTVHYVSRQEQETAESGFIYAIHRTIGDQSTEANSVELLEWRTCYSLLYESETMCQSLGSGRSEP